MKTDNPLVSVIVRTKDRPRLLLNAIRSLAGQTYRPLEAVLVNDGGSPPDMAEIRSALTDIELVYQDIPVNRGRAAAGNTGIEAARGEYIAFLDDDDEYYPGHISELVSCMREHYAPVVYADCEVRQMRYDAGSDSFEQTSSEPFLSYDFDPALLLFTNYIPLICAMFHRRVFDEIGGFDTSFDLYEDWDLFIRASRTYSFTHLRHLSAVYNKWDAGSQITLSSVGPESEGDRRYYTMIIDKHREFYTPDALYSLYGFYHHISQKYRDSMTSFSRLEREFTRVDGEKNRLDLENSGLWSEKGRLTSDLESTSTEKMRLEKENTRLWQLSGELEDKGERLKGNIRDLEAAGEQLRAERDRLDGERERLEAERERLEAGNAGLTALARTQEIQIRGLSEHNAALSSILSRIRGSRGWRLLSKYYALKEFILGTDVIPPLPERLQARSRRIAKRLLPRKIQIYLKLGLYHLLQERRDTRNPAQVLTSSPRVTIIIPVYNRAAYLPQALGSALRQDYGNFDVVAVDDCSTDPAARDILSRFSERHPKLRVIFNRQNSGISGTMNTAIAEASGEYIAFLDCDDFLPPDALSKAAAAIMQAPEYGYFFSDRINVDAGGKEVERVSFINRKRDNYLRELMKGMFTDHLKVIRKDAFLEVGLHDPAYDSVQDYEFALRYAFRHPEGFRYINDFLYFHRVYPEQVSVSGAGRQREAAEEAKTRSRRRVAISRGADGKKISIVILSFNKKEHTLRCIEAIKSTVRGGYEILVFDNNSAQETVKLLRKTYTGDPRVRLHFSDENLGCPGGRKKAIALCDGEYIVTLDNDIIVTRGWIEDLLLRVDESQEIAGACCRVVFPDNKIQYNGGKALIRDRFVEFSLIDSWKNASDVATMKRWDCDWIPGGATMYKHAVYERLSICDEFKNAYEDNDFSFNVGKLGYRLVNCPSAHVIHNHVMYDTRSALQETEYMASRYSHDALKQSVLAFYRRHGYIIKDDYVYRIFGFSGLDEEKILRQMDALAGEGMTRA
ncbi:MAG: glycosyltransferase [Nitrospiraceae bacterium]|nr:glycosyltransferase [Nitrospiraceae bacterium]